MEGHEETSFYNAGPSYFWLEVRYALTRWLLKRFGVFGHDGRSRARLIDLGCGPGNCLRGLPHSVICYGTDVSTSQLEVARAVSGSHVFQCSVTNIPLKPHSMTYAIMLDVAEHIKDDAAAFRDANRILTPGGFLFVTAPAYEILWGPHDDIHGHFRRYRRRALRKKLHDAGFEIVEGKYLLPFSFFVFLAFRFWKKVRRQKTDDFIHVSPFFNALLTTYFIAESTLSRFIPFPWGTIIYVVARKN